MTKKTAAKNLASSDKEVERIFIFRRFVVKNYFKADREAVIKTLCWSNLIAQNSAVVMLEATANAVTEQLISITTSVDRCRISLVFSLINLSIII
jgi:hypothetical protein